MADEKPTSVSRRALLSVTTLGASALAASAQAQSQARGASSGAVPDRAVGRPEPQVSGPQPLPEDRRVGYAIVGLGKYAISQILPAFAESKASKPVAVVSGNPEKAARVARQYGIGEEGVYSYETFDRIAQNPAVQAVYIILPTGLHAEWTIRAFRAGKHVMCEKPMASTPQECEAMIRAGEQAGRKLMIGYREHYEPHNLAAMKLVRDGEIGDLRVISTNNGRPTNLNDPSDQWRLDRSLSGGGALPDIGIYGLNAQRYFANEEPVEVQAWSFTPKNDPRFREVEDVITWQMRFPSGVIANGTTSYSYAGTSHFEVIGTKGRITMDPAANYDGHQVMLRTSAGDRRLRIQEVNQQARQIDHLSRAILNNTDVKSGGDEGLQDIRLITAIYQSARDGGRPVRTEFGFRRKMDVADTRLDEEPRRPA
jgi:glucose-fructose oxidoreductase